MESCSLRKSQKISFFLLKQYIHCNDEWMQTNDINISQCFPQIDTHLHLLGHFDLWINSKCILLAMENEMPVDSIRCIFVFVGVFLPQFQSQKLYQSAQDNSNIFSSTHFVGAELLQSPFSFKIFTILYLCLHLYINLSMSDVQCEVHNDSVSILYTNLELFQFETITLIDYLDTCFRKCYVVYEWLWLVYRHENECGVDRSSRFSIPCNHTRYNI